MGNEKATQIHHNVLLFSTWDKIIPLLIGVVFWASFFRTDWTDILFKRFSETAYHSSRWLVVLFSIALILTIFLHRGSFKKDRLLNPIFYPAINWSVFLSVSTYIIFVWRLTNINSADHSFRSVQHLDAILYSLLQVVAGKTILVDLPSQYGLFSELLVPIFKFIGLTTSNFGSKCQP